jgi:hypothetical protein
MNDMNPYVWRQRREDTRREAERNRLVRALRAERKVRTKSIFSLAWELRRIAGLLMKFSRRLESRNGSRS